MAAYQLRKMCDAYYKCVPVEYDESGEYEPGESRTFVNIEGDTIYNANRSAKLALDFYNWQNRKKFNLLKVCKLNDGGSCESLICCVQDDESDERRLFRCVVDMHDQVDFSEIKYDAEISNLVDHVDDYVKKIGERVLPSDTWCNSKEDLGDCSHPGSDGVILVSPTMFRILGEKSFLDLHKMCDDYLDPCLYDKCQMMTLMDVSCFDWVEEYAKSAIKLYNEKEEKKFVLVKVEKLYNSIFRGNENGYCLTFWARNDTSDEFRLFRAVFNYP